MTTSQEFAAKSIKINDAMIEGQLNESEWAMQVAELDAEMKNAGVTWDQVTASA